MIDEKLVPVAVSKTTNPDGSTTVTIGSWNSRNALRRRRSCGEPDLIPPPPPQGAARRGPPRHCLHRLHPLERVDEPAGEALGQQRSAGDRRPCSL